MKCKKTFTIILFYFISIFATIFYQSCKTYRTCLVVADIYGTYFNVEKDKMLLDSSSCKADNFGIAVAFRQNEYECKRSNFDMIQSAYAYKPNINYYSLDSITSINIFSNQDFDNTHKAGTLLNEYFTMSDLNEINISNTYTKNAFGYNIYLNKVPTDSTVFHSFMIEATTQSSNKIYTYTYQHIKLTP